MKFYLLAHNLDAKITGSIRNVRGCSRWFTVALVRKTYLVVIMFSLVYAIFLHKSDLFSPSSFQLVESTARELSHGHMNGTFTGHVLTLDERLLEPGDILLCHNPGGSYGYFTHSVLYVGKGRAVDAFDFEKGTKLMPLTEYRRYGEVDVLRVKAHAAIRNAAAITAEAAAGKGYDPFASVHDTHTEYCSKLIWHTFAEQGVVLCPAKGWVLPDDLYHSPVVEVVAKWA